MSSKKNRKRNIQLHTLCQVLGNVSLVKTAGSVLIVGFSKNELDETSIMFHVEKIDGTQAHLYVTFDDEDIDYITGAVSAFVAGDMFTHYIAMLHVDLLLNNLEIRI